MNYYFDVLKKYADFNGRASRSEYWMFLAFHMIIIFILAFLINFSTIFAVLYLAYIFGTLLPGIAVSVRRMHDVGKSGWYILIPIYNLILYCTEGDNGSNDFGPDPKDIGEEINEIGSPQ